ncbi:MAG: hypothetical protein CBC35_05905 [Planctomycetes bacterium TMED75]|nr:hypothetical protein [Planctomycetaceae bacterium]OUU93347.1 MAG: hypothetical protein CBC35_05905 [Planctomycetes bacterium TMED75]
MTTSSEYKNSPTPPPSESRRPPVVVRRVVAFFRFLLPLIVIAAAGYGCLLLIGSRPTPPRVEVPERATLVETMTPVPQNDRATITGFGTIEPHRLLALQPQVGGEIRVIAPDLIPGGLIAKNDILLQIDTLDFELALEQRKADIANAEVNLQLAEASSLVAQREWELIGDSIESTDIGEQLARKEPQKREAEAMLAAARGKLKLAQLDLDRTTIRAPFNALVLNDSIELGQIVAPRATIATLVGTDEFEVIASIPLAKLPMIRIDPEDPARNSRATISLELGEGRTLTRQARVARLAGEVERTGRLAKVIIEILDPLNREGVPGRGRLLLGSYVRVDIEGPELEDVLELPRSVLQENDTVWVMDDSGRLAVRSYEVILGRTNTVLVQASLEPGDQIITSPLGIAISGMPLETLESISSGTPTESAGESSQVVEDAPS